MKSTKLKYVLCSGICNQILLMEIPPLLTSHLPLCEGKVSIVTIKSHALLVEEGHVMQRLSHCALPQRLHLANIWIFVVYVASRDPETNPSGCSKDKIRPNPERTINGILNLYS